MTTRDKSSSSVDPSVIPRAEALQEYLQHKPDCELKAPLPWSSTHSRKQIEAIQAKRVCTCGLSSLLSLLIGSSRSAQEEIPSPPDDFDATYAMSRAYEEARSAAVAVAKEHMAQQEASKADPPVSTTATR